jgi:hypothetical protein
MKLALTDLDPHFLKRVSPVDFDFTDDIREAAALELQCPACHWAKRRTKGDGIAHMIILWGDPKSWQFVGRDYRNLSLMAGRVTAGQSVAGCGTRFFIRDGKVDFY